MIQPGQTYQQCDPGAKYPTRILIKGVIPWGAGCWGQGTASVVTVTEDGRELRPRSVSLSSLHDSPTTRDGKPRRTGYALEQPAAATEFIAAMRSRDPQELEELRHEAWCHEQTCQTCDGTGDCHQIGCPVGEGES